MTEIFTAKTVEEAKALAAAKFGKDVRSIKFEIIDEGKKGFLGIGKSDAKVKATYVPATVQSAAQAVKKATEKNSETASVPKKSEIKPADESKTVEAAPVEEKLKEAYNSENKKEKSAADYNDEEYSLDNFSIIEDESLENPKVKLAKDYIKSVLNAMDVDVSFTVYQNETGAVINIDSNNNGTIIGRRGETLDAIQYLCSIIANKGDKDYFRITIDCLGYRSKRKETLEQLAAKVAKSVLRTGRSQPLEPMNPYERRVIHSAISSIEGVSSRSVGEEPYRKIIISSNNSKSYGKKYDNRRGGEKDYKRNSRPRKENFERRSVDLSTSFEKDYKRPKPEDNIEGSLYGKIEL